MTNPQTHHKTRNETGRDHCAACDDEGWVELKGTETSSGITYTRGMAPCKWCEAGTRRFIRATTRAKNHRTWEPLSDFDGTDIIPHEQPGRKFTPHAEFLLEREAAGCKRAALQQMFPRSIWPTEWVASPPGELVASLTDDASISEKRRRALIAKNEAERELAGLPKPANKETPA